VGAILATNEAEAAVAAIDRVDAVPLILDILCRSTGMRFAAVARVTEDRWIACSLIDEMDLGIPKGGAVNLATMICREVCQTNELIVINDVATDPRYVNHPGPKLYGYVSYISMPIIRADGTTFGTLCALDPRPKSLNRPETLGMFKAFADLIASHLDAQGQHSMRDAELTTRRADAELREQFVAVLGHDLRNPLAAIQSGLTLLRKTPLNERALTLVDLAESSVDRMAALIENVMDFARGRLGGGLTVDKRVTNALETTLKHVVAEFQVKMPARVIETTFFVSEPIECDAMRISQLASNLLGNALTHGDQTQPVRVSAVTENGSFVFSVTNSGDPIPPSVQDRIFEPFSRGAHRASLQGLGLRWGGCRPPRTASQCANMGL
jgi:His Kinase A (phospho-acceptor) domain/GAF domain/Histidine kinase-, DNA gyrase B-, and HSP90-like ATPase